MNKSKYIIVVSTDSNYVKHTLTLLKSIEDNVKGEIEIYILSLSLSKTEKEFIRKELNLLIHFIDLSDKIVRQSLFPDGVLEGYMSLSSYCRLLIPCLLPQSIKKCLYIDVDGIILNDIEDLWNINIENYFAAAVKDTATRVSKEEIGLTCSDLYINAGFLLINLEKWREDNILDKFKDFIKINNGNVPHMDQGILNRCLSKGILELPLKYNFMTPLFFLNAKQANGLYSSYNITDEEINEALSHPVFIHFTKGGTSRPWESHCKHPLKYMYWKYRNKINLNSEIEEDSRTLKLRILQCFGRKYPIFTNRLIKTLMK